jgi:hypothetical protein
MVWRDGSDDNARMRLGSGPDSKLKTLVSFLMRPSLSTHVGCEVELISPFLFDDKWGGLVCGYLRSQGYHVAFFSLL